MLATGGSDKIRFWELLTGRPLHQIEHSAASLAFSLDGRWLASSAANVALVWDLQGLLGDNAPAQEKQLTQEEFRGLWRDLGTLRADHAAKTLARLVRGGEPTTT